jgi:peptidoglycan/LPS O-acetylase OafA/YrhL
VERVEARPSIHLGGVDLLRGVACLWVVLYHIGMWWLGGFWLGFPALASGAEGPLGRAFIWLTRLGFQGVSLFLVLSGFCLYFPLLRASGVRGAKVDLRVFAARRAARILPPYYASIALLAALASVPATSRVVMLPITLGDVAAHVAMLHNLFPATIWTMNGAYWTLALEAQLYLVFPLLVWCGRRGGPWAIGASGLVVSVLWVLALRTWVPDATGERYGVLYEAMPARLFELSAGMVAAHLATHRKAAALWPLVVLSLLWAPVSHVVHVEQSVVLPWDKLANGISFGALAVLAARLPASVLSVPPVRLLAAIGVMSFSLYLVHQPLLLLLQVAVHQAGLGPASMVAAGLGVSLAAGAVFYRLVERPALSIEAARRAAARRKRA